MANPEHQISRLDIILIGAIAGAIVGAVTVAALIATANYFSTGSNEAVLYYTFLSAVYGFCYGVIFGGLIGIVVGLFAGDKKLGSLLGAIAGCVLASYYFSASPDDRRILFGLSSIIIGTLSGMAAGTVINRVVESRFRRKTSLNPHH